MSQGLLEVAFAKPKKHYTRGTTPGKGILSRKVGTEK
jgi:hypothetical protein